MYQKQVMLALGIALLGVQVADPPTACSKLRVPVTPVVSWVALIQRSQEQDAECTFDMKVSGLILLCRVSTVCHINRLSCNTMLSAGAKCTASWCYRCNHI